jgi:hypothetical protein
LSGNEWRIVRSREEGVFEGSSIAIDQSAKEYVGRELF